MDTKNDKAWASIFEKYKIIKEINKNSFYEITANQIKEFREPRLMTKFDQKANLPKLFLENNLSILPITRGSYIIGKFKTYEKIKYSKVETIPFSIPPFIESIDPNNIYSEATALNTVYAGGVINHILGEESLQTISGRMGTGYFNFSIDNDKGSFNVDVNNSQCEIDAGFESQSKLVLLEAKNFKIDSFNIRQMYYPYRLWKDKVKKEVIPAFFTYSSDIFSFFIYKFKDKAKYNSLELVEQRNFAFEEEPISMDEIYSILNNTSIVEEPSTVPFPQANNFNRTIDLLGLLMENNLTKDEIASYYNFEKRQADYYSNAAIYLGLVQKESGNGEVTCELTTLGRKVMGKRHREKMLEIVRLILEHQIFNRVLRKYFDNSSPVTIEDIIEIMNTSYIHNVERGSSTVGRRASTVLRWIEWILKLAVI
jgi:hypothetical protein